MNQFVQLPYIESEGESAKIPFDRYLPPYEPGMASNWLKSHTAKDTWVLEPIGASPRAILEMAEAGYRVLAAINNPVTAFELTILAQAPARKEFEAALGELSIQKRGSERLGTFIQNQYLTRCASCGKEISAEFFLWHKSESIPYARIYHCPFCGDEGEHPVTDFDIERLAPYKRSDPLHRARALERVPGGTREARQNLEEVLNIYSARPLYALFTLINKLEGMSLPPQRRALLDALLLSALDAGHSLWSAEESNDRPRVVNIPAVSIERNIWLVMENAIDLWCTERKPVQLTHWPELPESNGICLFQGRMRDLAQKKVSLPVENIVCVLPRPSQVFWTLSTLWSSWLWGKENALNLKNVLERQRFDWYWHTNALQSALAPAARMVRPSSPVFTLLPEPVPGFVAAAMEACCASNLSLAGVAWKEEQQPVQMEWFTQSGSRETKKVNLHKVIREAIHECLSENGEPCRYLKVYTAVIASVAASQAFPATIQQLTYETALQIHNEITREFADRKFLHRLDNTAQDPESGYWWLAQPEGCQVSLTDRVESEIVQWLQKDKQIAASSVQKAMNTRFPGFLTPSAELLDHCLQSYANLEQTTQIWILKKNEDTAHRNKDFTEIHSLVFDLAGRIGFRADGENPILWSSPNAPDQPVYRLTLSTTALISRHLKEESMDNAEKVFLFPGSRSALLHYKLEHDPWLRTIVSQKWHFLKFRMLRELARRKELSRDLWDLFLDSDPISQEDATQLSMFL